MDVFLALTVVGGLLVISTLLGWAWRARTGRARSIDGPRIPVDVAQVNSWGERATLLQFSSDMCSKCPGTARFLTQVAEEYPGVIHAEVNLSREPRLADEYRITQTPSVFLLDGYGRVASRINGAPRREELRQHLDELLRRPRVDYSI